MSAGRGWRLWGRGAVYGPSATPRIRRPGFDRLRFATVGLRVDAAEPSECDNHRRDESDESGDERENGSRKRAVRRVENHRPEEVRREPCAGERQKVVEYVAHNVTPFERDPQVGVYPLGHLGMALLFAAPVAVLLDRKTATGFSLFVLVTALLPDVDTYVPFLTHHGATHTIAFAVVAGPVGGLLIAGGLVALRAATDSAALRRLSPTRVFLLGGLAVSVGALSHVVSDLLVVLPGTEPIPLFWPVVGEKYEIAVVHLGGPVRNAGLFVGGLLAHMVVSWRVANGGARAAKPLD